MFNFSAECDLSTWTKDGTQNQEFSCFSVVGEWSDTFSVLDGCLEEEIKNYEQIQELSDGRYHVYFVGTCRAYSQDGYENELEILIETIITTKESEQP
jgi:hypothetical protein